MSLRAWAYVWSILLVGMVLGGIALFGFDPATAPWFNFLALTTLATLAQLFKAEAPTHQLYSATPVFAFAGVLLLPPFLFVLMVAISHSIGWAKERLTHSRHLRNWYLQPFNISMHLIAGFFVLAMLLALNGGTVTFTGAFSAVVLIAAAFAYDGINHIVIGLAISLARKIPFRESGILDRENLLIDGVLFLLGGTVGVVWNVHPLLIIPVLSPLILIYQSLHIPLLKREASTDEKTGLWNDRHFAKLFLSEIERAKRFGHPLSFIMADLDLLRNINNTYGHLAGDAVLTGIGKIIRENLRDYDIAGRFGGEEFAIALPETDVEQARAIAERIRETIQNTRFTTPTGSTVRATMSFGVSPFTPETTVPTDVIHEADIAVYQAKLKGRNRVICASEVPHSIKLESLSIGERFGPGFEETFTSPQVTPVQPAPSPAQTAPAELMVATQESNSAKALSGLFTAGIITLGFVVSLSTVATWSTDWVTLVLFAVLGLTTELLHLNLGTMAISASGAIIFAVALVQGLPGVLSISLVIAVTRLIRRRPPLTQVAFAWATNVLAGIAPVLALRITGTSLEISSLPLLLIPMAAAALAWYLIETLLISVKGSLASQSRHMNTWLSQFGWLAPHYIALYVMGFFLAIAYMLFGVLGMILFTIPLLMMRYAEKQYIHRTEQGFRELRRMNEELDMANREILSASTTIQSLNDGLFQTLAKIIDTRDRYVADHSHKVALYATAIAREMGLPPERVVHIRQAALLHDIGKIAISEQVLAKTSKLNANEYEHVKTHALLGADLIATSPSLKHLARFIRNHHERWDGQGYPDRLQREQIPLEARILSVSDAVECMASDRPYRHAMWVSDIACEIKRCAGTQFDPQVAEILLRLLDRGGQDFLSTASSEPRPKDGPETRDGKTGASGTPTQICPAE